MAVLCRKGNAVRAIHYTHIAASALLLVIPQVPRFTAAADRTAHAALHAGRLRTLPADQRNESSLGIRMNQKPRLPVRKTAPACFCTLHAPVTQC